MASGRILAAVICAGAAAWCAPAYADVDGKARLGNVGFVLADLDPNDGIAPALRFIPDFWEPSSGWVNIVYREDTPNGIELVNDIVTRTGDDGNPLVIDYRWQAASSHASLTQRSDPLAQLLYVETHLPAGNRWRHAGQDVDSDRIAFDLTPNTAVSFFGTLEVDGAASPDDYYSSFGVFARLEVSIELEENWIARVEDIAEFSTRASDLTLDDSARLFATYEHRGSGTTRGFADLTLAGRASTLAAIPEPSQGAMLAGGALLLAGLGALFRRAHAGGKVS